jgi:hypothetical protein
MGRVVGAARVVASIALGCALAALARAESGTDVTANPSKIELAPVGSGGAESRAAGGGAAKIELPTKREVDDVIPEGGRISGREIYDRFLKNKLHSGVQYQKVISIDPGGSTQESRFWVRWKDYRKDDKPTDGVYSKTLVKFLDPFDMKGTGFLMVVREGKSGEKKVTSDQFVYQPSARRVRRVKLDGTSVGGTDITFDDIAFDDIDDAEYDRLQDEEIDGTPVYVVEAMIKPTARSKYSRTLSFLEQEHYVPLRVRYWDHADVEVKEMNANHDSIREFIGTWVATESLVTNLKEGTSSRVFVENLDPNVEIADRLFSLFRLEYGRH